jgi:serpin B
VNLQTSLRGIWLGALVTGWIVLTGAAAWGQAGANAPPAKPDTPPPYAVAADGNNAFAFDLYARLKLRDADMGNVCFSPYSISSALAMTRVGARGVTADEMSAALHLTADVSAIETSYGALNQSLVVDEKKQGYALNVANALWSQKGSPVLPEFLNVVKKNFDGDLTPVDFAGHAEDVRLQINQWAANKTHDKIKDLLLPGMVDSASRLILTNAIYFKGQWAAPFDAKQTSKDDFRTRKGDLVKADMMHMSHQLLYAEDDLCQVVELPYQGDHVAMLVLLPKPDNTRMDRDGTPDPLKIGMMRLESALNPQYMDQIRTQIAYRSVNVALPKWEVTKEEDTLENDLTQLGMRRAFTPQADFSGIDGEKDLYLTTVIHKAYVKVDEEGTEAAAATAIVALGGPAPKEPPPVDFTANRSFIYMILHEPSNTILFAGRLSDPTVPQ